MAGGPCATCGGACGATCRKVCGSECGGSCGDQCVPQGPIDHLRTAATCGAGCDEVYWDEWVSDPPDCVDPCDDCGNWIGHQPCAGPIRSGWLQLLGLHNCGKHGYGSSCATCGCDDSVPVEGVVYEEGPMYGYEAVPQTLPAPRTAPVQKKAPPQQPRTIPYYDREQENSAMKPIR